MDKQTISTMMEVIGDLLPADTSIAVSDQRQFIYYQPSKTIDLHIKPGDAIREGSATFKALTVRRKVAEYIDGHLFGVPYYGMSMPILEHGQPTGCVTAILPSKPHFLSTFLTIKKDDRWVPIPYEQIVYLEAQSRKSKVATIHGEGYHKFQLSELEFFLPNDSFIRVHRSYIINIHYIKEIHPDSHSTFLLIMKDQSKISVSQSYSKYFRKALCF